MGQVLEHKHIIIRAEVTNAPIDETTTINSIKDLVQRINMKILMGPFAKYCDMVGNRGLTVATIIETSHIVMHSWDECSPHMIQLDVYTCGTLEIGTVLDWLSQFDPSKIDYKFLDREHSFTEILTQHITLNNSVLNTASSNAVSEQAAVGTRAV